VSRDRYLIRRAVEGRKDVLWSDDESESEDDDEGGKRRRTVFLLNGGSLKCLRGG
jgi:hypothetical protein